jgi:hypothetical protein
MGLQAAVHLGHTPWGLTKEEEQEEEHFPQPVTQTQPGTQCMLFKTPQKPL